MKQTIILFFGAALLTFWGCQEEQIQLTDSGYKYVTCVDLEGNPGAPSDWIFIHAVTRAGDEILEDTRERGDAVPIQLSPDPMQQARNPFQDVLSIMSIGDSIQLEYPLDSIQAPPPDVPEGVTALTYELKVVDIMGPQEFQEWRSEQMSKNRAKVEEVEALVAGIYADYKAGNLDIQRTETGLGYVIHEVGNGRTAELGISNKFHFTGFLKGDEVFEMLDMSDVYVMPSVSEPFGISPLEAMQSNVPVIISHQSGVAEILTHAKKVDFWDTDAIADAIHGIISYPALSKMLVKHGRKEAASLKWEDSANNVRSIYRSTMIA